MAEGRRCGLGAVKVSKRPQNWTPEPFSDMNIALNIRPPIPYPTLDESKRRQDSKIRRTLSVLMTRSTLAEVQHSFHAAGGSSTRELLSRLSRLLPRSRLGR